jgi:uncharacterized membrane protein YhaH (DUF805 family)
MFDRPIVSPGGFAMNFSQAISAGFANYTVFVGRATRSEYWYWLLFAAIGVLVTKILDAALFAQMSASGPSPLHALLTSIFILVLLLPSFAVEVRRLHDTDRSGWWLLLALSGIGVFLLLYWASQEGTPGDNRFGPSPSPDEALNGRRLA